MDIWPLTGRVFPLGFDENQKDILAAGPLTYTGGVASRVILMKKGTDSLLVAVETFPQWPDIGTRELEEPETFPLAQIQKAVLCFGERTSDNSSKVRVG